MLSLEIAILERISILVEKNDIRDLNQSNLRTLRMVCKACSNPSVHSVKVQIMFRWLRAKPAHLIP